MATNNQENDNNKALLITANHNYFVRQTISTFCGLIILTTGFAFLVSIFQIGVSQTIDSGSVADSAASGMIVFASLAYIIVVVVQLGRLMSLHGKVTAAEKESVAGHIAK